jgi:hypothetical protein
LNLLVFLLGSWLGSAGSLIAWNWVATSHNPPSLFSVFGMMIASGTFVGFISVSLKGWIRK